MHTHRQKHKDTLSLTHTGTENPQLHSNTHMAECFNVMNYRGEMFRGVLPDSLKVNGPHMAVACRGSTLLYLVITESHVYH